MRGEVVKWFPDLRYGFVKPPGQTDVFLHLREVRRGRPSLGASVEFEIGKDIRNGVERPTAKNVRVIQ
jgi:cold shock CspA family protein